MYSFPIQESEMIIKKSLANVEEGDTVYSGALYLTNRRLVFVGYLPDSTNKYMEEVPLEHIEKMTPGTSLFIIPNVLYIDTIRGRKLKVVIRRRDEWIKTINQSSSF